MPQTATKDKEANITQEDDPLIADPPLKITNKRPEQQDAVYTSPASDTAEKDWSSVEHGQLTFDSEGNNIAGSRYFSRKVHWPGNNSGVTIGRGYDLAHRSSDASVIKKELNEVGIDASKFEGAIGLEGVEASKWLKKNLETLPIITEEQQYKLFEITYAQFDDDAERLATKDDVEEKYGDTDWENLHPAIRETVVDLRYRGDYTPRTRQFLQKAIAGNDLQAFYNAMTKKSNWKKVPEDRFTRRVDFLKGFVQDSSSDSANLNKQHKVISGESPSMIAKKYGVTVEALKKANIDLWKVHPAWQGFNAGDVITIPFGTLGDEEKSQAGEESAVDNGTEAKEVKIKPGKYLESAVGRPSEKFPAESINLVKDVRLIQAKLLELGLLSEEDAAKEVPKIHTDLKPLQRKSALPLQTNNVEKQKGEAAEKEPVEESPVRSAVEAQPKQMVQNVAPEKLTATIDAIETYQLKVMHKDAPEGRINPNGATITGFMQASQDNVTKKIEGYEAYKAKKESDAFYAAEADKAIERERQRKEKVAAEKRKKEEARVKKLKQEPSNKSNIKKIYDRFDGDIKCLADEMRKYAPYNQKLVIEMLDYVDWEDQDDLAYNIVFFEPNLNSYPKTLLLKLKDELEEGWEGESEQELVQKLDALISADSKRNISKKAKKSKSNTDLYTNQRDNKFNENNVYSKYVGRISGDNMCNVTTLAMQLKKLYPSNDKLKKDAISILIEKGSKSSVGQFKNQQVEDILLQIFKLLGDKYFEEKLNITPNKTFGPHQYASALNHVASFFDKYVGDTNFYTNILTKKDYNEKVKPAMELGGSVMLSSKLTAGHIVYLKQINNDGILIHDPYGIRLSLGYVKNGSKVSIYKNRINKDLSTFNERTKENEKLRREVLDELKNDSTVHFQENLGESNFYSWNEVAKYSIGKWVNILNRK